MAQAVAGPSSAGGRNVVNYDDQVVPALRRRLESESAYLSDRLSTASFPSINGVDVMDPPPLKRETSAARTRTKSSHVHGNAHYGAPSGMSQPSRSIPIPTSTAASSRSRSRSPSKAGPSRDDDQDQAAGESHSAPRPSRIPMRPRSKSNLGTRPSPPTPSSSTKKVPRLPSGLPRPVRRSGNGKESPELVIIETKENKKLRDELPPFRMEKGEAMRIAEKGHVLRDGDEVFGIRKDIDYGEEGENGQRKRRQTTRSGSKNSVKLADETPPLPISTASSSGLPRSATGNVGLGLPSTRGKGSQLNQNARSSSSRQPANHLSASGTTPRSASLNMLAQSGSRLGIAAHLVPPESTYTPPKGQSWDEVVLPTVAKKMGLGDSPSPQSWAEEGDLAVEWDKSGTPVKWIKRESVKRLGGPGEASKALKDRGLPGDDFITSQNNSSSSSNLHPLSSSTKSAFSPSFEPSPDNPLTPRYLRAHASHSSLTPSPSPTPRHQTSREHLQAHPIRTSSGQWASLRQSPPPSPAPFSQMQPLNQSTSGPRPVRSFDNSVSRKPSTLRKNGQSQKTSRENLKTPTTGGETYFTDPRPAPLNGPGSGVYDGRRTASNAQYPGGSREEERNMDQSAWSPASAPSRRGGRKEKADSHGKGCGCVIM